MSEDLFLLWLAECWSSSQSGMEGGKETIESDTNNDTKSSFVWKENLHLWQLSAIILSVVSSSCWVVHHQYDNIIIWIESIKN